MIRIPILIRQERNPESILQGYAMVTELNENIFTFFCTEKFGVDENLVVSFSIEDQQIEQKIKMASIHEHISSGRIMNAVPTPGSPFPARKFYRCFARIQKVEAAVSPVTSGETEMPVEEQAKAVA